MDTEPAHRAQLEPDLHLPRVGLEEVLRGWNGDGPVYAALAAIQDSSLEFAGPSGISGVGLAGCFLGGWSR